MEMFTNNNGKWKIENGKLFITMTFFVLCLVVLKCYAFDNFHLVATSNQDLQAKLDFLDKLSICQKHKYQEDGIGSYEIFGKQNQACKVKWTLVDCNFPEGVYQEFSSVQKKRVVERYNNIQDKYYIEIEDADYRYLYNTGNKFCTNRY